MHFYEYRFVHLTSERLNTEWKDAVMNSKRSKVVSNRKVCNKTQIGAFFFSDDLFVKDPSSQRTVLLKLAPFFPRFHPSSPGLIISCHGFKSRIAEVDLVSRNVPSVIYKNWRCSCFRILLIARDQSQRFDKLRQRNSDIAFSTVFHFCNSFMYEWYMGYLLLWRVERKIDAGSIRK